jgi:patatin-like phospholipase/acyl hydrolase
LAHGLSAATLSTLLESLGPKLFGKPGLGIQKPKHDRSALEAKLKAMFGDKRLSDLQGQVLVPAVNLTGGEAVVFRNAANDPTRASRIVDVALATTAAPYFLAPHASDQRLYADGGLVANSPEALSAMDALHRHRWGRDRTTLLVVGSTQTSARLPGHLIGANWGAGDWLKDKRILISTMRAQMSLARQMAVGMLGPERVLVADVELSEAEAKTVALDKASARATQNLKTLASEAFSRFSAENPAFFQSA